MNNTETSLLPTPETDAAELFGLATHKPVSGEGFVPSRFARKLERGRNEARNQAELLARVIKTVQALPTMTDEQLAELQANCKKVMENEPPQTETSAELSAKTEDE